MPCLENIIQHLEHCAWNQSAKEGQEYIEIEKKRVVQRTRNNFIRYGKSKEYEGWKTLNTYHIYKITLCLVCNAEKW